MESPELIEPLSRRVLVDQRSRRPDVLMEGNGESEHAKRVEAEQQLAALKEKTKAFLTS